MFDQLMESCSKYGKPKKPLGLVFSILVHASLIMVLIIIPLLFPETLAVQLKEIVGLVAPPPPPGAAPATPAPSPAARKAVKKTKPTVLHTPLKIPPEIARISEKELQPPVGMNSIIPGGIPGAKGNTPGAILEGVSGAPPATAAVLPPPSSPPAPSPKLPAFLRVGTGVQQANLLFQVKPVYPPIAKQARIQGTVALEAIISKQGNIVNLKVISGPPLLIPAALEAVKQWRYKPTLLNNEPVDVLTNITVNFSLNP